MIGHTPGPWTRTGTSVQKHEGSSDYLIVDSATHDFGGEEAIANARLIAAAPDLLAELKALLAAAEQSDAIDDTAIVMARVAIAKAEGH